MSFWEDLSPLVKRYIIVAGVLLGALLAMRTCMRPQPKARTARAAQH